MNGLIARRSTMMQPRGGGGHNLPPEYQEVEWLENRTATGAIPLTVYPSNSIGMRGLFGRGAMYDEDHSEIAYSRRDTGKTRWGFGTDGKAKVVAQYGNTYHSHGIGSNFKNGDYLDFNFMNSHQLCFNDVYKASIPNQEEFSSFPLVSGGRYDDAGNLFYLDGIPPIHELILTDGSNVISDLIACYRKSDNQAGYYDIFNHEYLPSVGTGFTIGPDVN